MPSHRELREQPAIVCSIIEYIALESCHPCHVAPSVSWELGEWRKHFDSTDKANQYEHMARGLATLQIQWYWSRNKRYLQWHKVNCSCAHKLHFVNVSETHLSVSQKFAEVELSKREADRTRVVIRVVDNAARWRRNVVRHEDVVSVAAAAVVVAVAE